MRGVEVESADRAERRDAHRRRYHEGRQRIRSGQAFIDQIVKAVGSIDDPPHRRVGDAGFHAQIRNVDTGALHRFQCGVDLFQRGGRSPSDTAGCCSRPAPSAAARYHGRRRQFVHQTEQRRHLRMFQQSRAVGLDEFDRPTGIARGQGVVDRLHEHVVVGKPFHRFAVQRCGQPGWSRSRRRRRNSANRWW